MLRLIFLLLFVQILFSCKQQANQREIVREMNKYGKVISELSYTKDSILDGPAMYYYDNSILSDSLYYRNGLREGLHYHFDSLGNIESIIQFYKGKQDGAACWFYPNGKLQEKGFWWKGDAFGNYYWFSLNGNISSYCFYNFQGKCGYKIDFDSSGKKIREEGRMINQVHFTNKALQAPQEGFPILLQTGDSLALEIAIATPLIYTTTLQLKVRKNEMLVENRFIKIGNTPLTYKRLFDSSGIFNFHFHLEAIDKANGNKQEDLSIVVIVNDETVK